MMKCLTPKTLAKFMLTVLVAPMVTLVGTDSEARADSIIFCNKSDRPIYMALSSSNNLHPEWGISTNGWWYATSGQCATVVSTGNINDWEWYGYYAVSEDGQKEWKGTCDADGCYNVEDACVSDSTFSIVNAQNLDTCIPPSYFVKFKWFLIQRDDIDDFTFDFTN